MENLITVEIDPIGDYPKTLPLSSPIFEGWCIGKLKSAGIPIRGALIFRGVESGILTRYEDFERPNIMLFSWRSS